MNFAPVDSHITIFAHKNSYLRYAWLATQHNTGEHAKVIQNSGDAYWGRANAEPIIGVLNNDQYGQRPALYMESQ